MAAEFLFPESARVLIGKFNILIIKWYYSNYIQIVEYFIYFSSISAFLIACKKRNFWFVNLDSFSVPR